MVYIKSRQIKAILSMNPLQIFQFGEKKGIWAVLVEIGEDVAWTLVEVL